LPLLNNERGHPKSEINKKRFAHLNWFVMVKFSWDPMVYPRESSWFGENGPDGKTFPMEETSLFKEDKFGLKSLADEGRIEKKEI